MSPGGRSWSRRGTRIVCDPAADACTGPCAADAPAGSGHLGREFHAVSLTRSESGDELFGGLVTNPGDERGDDLGLRPAVVPPVTSDDADRPIGASVHAAGSGMIGSSAGHWHPVGLGPADA